jgi:hypothetical protein
MMMSIDDTAVVLWLYPRWKEKGEREKTEVLTNLCSMYLSCSISNFQNLNLKTILWDIASNRQLFECRVPRPGSFLHGCIPSYQLPAVILSRPGSWRFMHRHPKSSPLAGHRGAVKIDRAVVYTRARVCVMILLGQTLMDRLYHRNLRRLSAPGDDVNSLICACNASSSSCISFPEEDRFAAQLLGARMLH